MIKKILILSANPKDTERLSLGEEVREIENALQRFIQNGEFKIKQVWATRLQDFRRAMLNFKPNIVHFSGHGEGDSGIIFENRNGYKKTVNAEALSEFFKNFSSHVRCVVLNACYSEIQAKAISLYIDYVIGMNHAISDKLAIEFAVSFYDALGAYMNIEAAFSIARSSIKMEGLPEDLMPVLLISAEHLINKKEFLTTIDKTCKNDCTSENIEQHCQVIEHDKIEQYTMQIFISYSHEDENYLNEVKSQLQFLEYEHNIKLWHDTEILTGTKFDDIIKQEITNSSLAVLLITQNYLSSKYIMKTELPYIKKNNLYIFPIIMSYCAWAKIKWLKDINVKPKNGVPLSNYKVKSEKDKILSEIAGEITDICLKNIKDNDKNIKNSSLEQPVAVYYLNIARKLTLFRGTFDTQYLFSYQDGNNLILKTLKY